MNGELKINKRMKEQDPYMRSIVQKFINGKCSAEELNCICEMEPGVFDNYLQTLKLEEEGTTIAKANSEMYRRIEEALDFKRRSFSVYPYLKAASVAFLLIGSLSWYYFKYGQAVQYSYATTHQTEQIKVPLEDGTVVWLNSYSQLKYPTHFNADKREVFLDGEGYFEVKKESKRPFIVHFDKSEVKVLGTTFNVKSFSNEPDKYVTLLTGIVNVKNGEREWRMQPGEETHIDKTGEVRKYKANMAISMAWREKVFQFYRTPLVDVANAIKRWYGVDVQIPDEKLHQRKVTIRINQGEKLYAVLNALTEAVNLKYKREGDGVKIVK